MEDESKRGYKEVCGLILLLLEGGKFKPKQSEVKKLVKSMRFLCPRSKGRTIQNLMRDAMAVNGDDRAQRLSGIVRTSIVLLQEASKNA